MKHFYRLILALSLAITPFACATNELDEQIAANTTTTAVPEEIYADFDEESTRVQLDALCRTTWTKGDLASAFYFSDKVSVFRFMGRTGDRSGALQCISQGTGGTAIDKVVLLYPHSESYALNASKGRIGVTIPDVQYYQEGSYGVGANLMASVGEDTKFSLKNLCGWVKVQFVGAGTVSEVTLSGNGYEQVAGDASFYYNDFRLALLGQEDASEDDSELGGSLVFGEYKTTVKLDCGEGIALDPTEPTEFYLVLAPQTFEEGITVTATLTDGTTLTKSTSKPLTVERNHIVPMSPLEVVAQSMREIHYTATAKVVPYNTNAFDANIVSNEWDSATGKGVITFDGKVTTIGESAFYACWSLTSVTIPDSVTTIGEWAFYDCWSLESITIPEGVTSIGERAFYRCLSLASITIPEGVTSIGERAFYCCSSLTSVTIPDGVTSIGDYAFYNCESLASITIPDGVASIGDGAFSDCWSLASITIPNRVTKIGNYAFSFCTSLANITIPNSVTSIGSYAFGCSSLESVTIPDGVASIGDGAFTGCSSLAEFEGKFASEDGRCLIVDGVLNAFAPYGLTEYTIPDGVAEIGMWAFYHCTSLTSITIPEGVASIGNYAFQLCSRLESITIPDSVTSIGDVAFNNCMSLESVTIPEGVASIGDGAFSDCWSLAEVYCKATTPPRGGGYSMFDNNTSERKIYVPAESLEAYKSAQYWSDYADSIYPFSTATVTVDQIGEAGCYRVLNATVVAANMWSIFVDDGHGVIMVWFGNSGGNQPSHDCQVGDVLNIEGEIKDYCGRWEFSDNVWITKTGTTTVERGEPEILTAASAEAFISAPSVKYISHTGTLLSAGDTYNNISIDGSETAILGVIRPFAEEAELLKSLEGKTVSVKGYAYHSASGKYIHIVMTEVEEVVAQ